jgi:8-oxo-dGTP diphosphatase
MKTFYVGIKGVIVRDGKVLLLRTNPDHEDRGARWEVAGGRIEGEETLEQALRRELGEELLNIRDVKIGDLLGVHRLHHDPWEGKSLVLVYYHVTAEFGGDPELSDEHLGWEWADAERVKELINDPSQNTILKALTVL